MITAGLLDLSEQSLAVAPEQKELANSSDPGDKL
jgi:hypothetical protein